MEVDVWVPIAVAIITGLGGYAAAIAVRKQTPEERRNRETELALSGLLSLLNEVQEERSECRRELERVLGIIRQRDRPEVI